MASHAGLGGRNSGKSAFFDGRMAIAAIDTHARHVMLVAKMDRLINRHIDHIHEVNTIDIEDDTKYTCHDQQDG
jgi:hypothetical protein